MDFQTHISLKKKFKTNQLLFHKNSTEFQIHIITNKSLRIYQHTFLPENKTHWLTSPRVNNESAV